MLPVPQLTGSCCRPGVHRELATPRTSCLYQLLCCQQSPAWMPITPSCVPHLVPLCLEKVQAGTASSAEGTRQCCRTPEGSWPPGSNKLLCLARGLLTLMGPFSLSSRASEHAPGMPGTQNSNTSQGKIMAYTKVG